MKKLLFLSAAALLFTAKAALAQFEGTIAYTIEMPNMTPEQQSMMGNSTFNIYVKNDKSRSDMSMGPVNVSTITNYKEKFQVSLTDMMGNKYMIRQTLDQFNKDKEGTTQTVKLIDGETKTIAGYKCKKAEVTSKDKEGKEFTTTVWYTEEFSPSSSTDFSKFNGLKGFPMEFEVKQGPYTMKMSVKSITKEAIADSKFEIPAEGYKVVASREEMQKDMQKNMGGGH